MYLKMNVERKIDTLDLEYNVKAYTDSIYIDGKLYKKTEGITEENNLGISGLDDIKSDNYYYILAKEDYEGIRTDINYHLKPIKNPYTELLQKNNMMIVKYDSYKELYQKLDGTYIPKAMYFDYISEFINDKCFDLDKLEKYLLTHPDKFRNVKKDDVPWYNRNEDQESYISFVWTPTEEEYNVYIQSLNGEYDSFKKKAITLLNLDQFRISGVSYE